MRRCLGHAHDFIGHAIGFLLVHISRLVDFELGLKETAYSSVTDRLMKL
jgi:hypothetical protein